jgi:hypothetical protein
LGPFEVMLGVVVAGVACRVLYMLPSGLVAGYEGASEQLVDAAKKLDEKLEVLIRDVIQD